MLTTEEQKVLSCFDKKIPLILGLRLGTMLCSVDVNVWIQLLVLGGYPCCICNTTKAFLRRLCTQQRPQRLDIQFGFYDYDVAVTLGSYRTIKFQTFARQKEMLGERSSIS